VVQYLATENFHEYFILLPVGLTTKVELKSLPRKATNQQLIYSNKSWDYGKK
jgi:hypothetical protein